MCVRLTRHAIARAQQRAFNNCDVELIREYRMPVPDDRNEVYFMRKKDVVAAVTELPYAQERLERLGGCTAVLAGDEVITVYRASASAKKTTAATRRLGSGLITSNRRWRRGRRRRRS